MEWLSDISGLLTGILAIALIIGGGWAAMVLGTSKFQRDHIADLANRVEHLEKDRDEKTAALAQITADRDALARVITGEAHWVALGDQLNDHHQEANDHWTKTQAHLEQILEVLRSTQGA